MTERDDMIAATVERYKSGEFGWQRASAMLVLCGQNAKEIEELLKPHRASAFENFKNYKRHPVK